MNISGISSVQATTFGRSSSVFNAAAQTSQSGDDALADALAGFKTEAAKTPAQRARDEVLKKHNLSEEQYKALPESQRKALDQEIKQAQQRASGLAANATSQKETFSDVMSRLA